MYCGSTWTPALQFSVLPNSGIFKIHDFRHSWIFHGSHGGPMGTPWGPHGDPMGSHGNPWEPMGPMDPMDVPWIFHELSGRPEADKKCGGVWGGREPWVTRVAGVTRVTCATQTILGKLITTKYHFGRIISGASSEEQGCFWGLV